MAKKPAKKVTEPPAQETAAVAAPTRKMVAVEGPHVPTYYVNSVQVDVSSFDIRFRMGQIHSGSSTELRVNEIAYVFMSHAHAKAFYRVLSDLLPRIEAVLKADDAAGADGKTH